MDTVVKCPNCGNQITFRDKELLLTCGACGWQVNRPVMVGQALEHFQWATEQRLNKDFYHAEESYRQALQQYPDDVDALWGLLLCIYGASCTVEEDGGRLWQIYATQPETEPMIEHPVMKKILDLLVADGEAQERYKQYATYIDNAMNRIRELAKKGVSYDIFLCHKTTREDGSKTEEYILAQELYMDLQKRGYSVFFAPESLPKEAGSDYEAGIYRALHTAKVMLIVCKDESYLHSKWVYSEWKRYLRRMKDNDGLLIIPLLYPPMDETKLPAEFTNRKIQGILMDHNGKENLFESLKPYAPAPRHPWRPIIALAIAVVVIAGAAVALLGGGQKEGDDASTVSPTATVTQAPAATQYRVRMGDGGEDAQRAIGALKRLYYLDGAHDTFDTTCATAFMVFCEDNGLPVEMDVSSEAFERLLSYDAVPKTTPMIAAALGTAALNGGGNTRTIDVTANDDWTVMTTYDWITLDKTGGSGNGAVTVTLADNPSTTASRTGYVTFSCGIAKTARVEIVQARRDHIAVSASGEGLAREIAVEANGDWTATTEDDWITLLSNSGTADGAVSVSLAENPSTQEARTGYVTFTCGTAETTVTITQPRTDSIGVSATGEGLNREIAVEANGPWTAETEADWVHLDVAGGDANAVVRVTLDENPSTQQERTADITFRCGTAKQMVTITQARRDHIAVSASGEGLAREMTVEANGPWTATANDDWIHLVENSGAADATVSVTLAANPSTQEAREGTITFRCGTAEQTVTITQPRADSIRVSATGEGLTREITVEANGPWTAAADAEWIHVKTSSGTADATVSVTLDENPSLTQGRTGAIIFTCGTAEQTVTISQGKQDSIAVTASAEGTASASGVVRNITVTANGPWTARTQADWITLKPASGEAGTTTGTLTLTANTSTEQGRTAVITFACGTVAQEMTITQAKQDALSADVTEVTISAEHTITSIAVAANGAWKASTTDDWIRLQNAEGQGDGTLIAAVEANPSTTSERVGSIVLRCGLAEQVVTIHQERADAITATAGSTTFTAAQGDSTIRVTANGPWTAQTSGAWLELKETSGDGDAVLSLTVAANESIDAGRTGSITFTCGTATSVVTIEQARQDSLSVSLDETMTCDASGRRIPATLKANGPWTAESSDAWLELNKPSGTGNVTFTVTVAPNESTTSDRTGILTFTCGTVSRTVTITQAKQDTIDAQLSAESMAASGGDCLLTVTANGSWTAESSADWLTLGDVSGAQSGTMTVRVAANESITSDRTATITLRCGAAMKEITLQQAKRDNLSVTLEESLSFRAAGGKETGTLKANGPWTAEASDDWIHLNRPSGTGNSAITITADANPSITDDRTGIVTFTCGTATTTVTVTQAKQDSLNIALDARYQFDATGGGIAAPVEANGPWTAEVSAPWITLDTTAGSGEGTVNITVSANDSTSSGRTGSVTFTCGTADQTVTIEQTKLDTVTASLAGSPELSSSAASRTIAVNANGSWTAQTDAAWIQLKDVSGNGVGSARIQVEANASTTQDRTGTITFTCGAAKDTVTITQAKQDSIAAELDGSRTIAADETECTIRVTANGAWTASTAADWLTVRTKSGTGSAEVTISADANPSVTQAREGTITFTCGTARATVTITQQRKDSIAVSGESGSVVSGGETRTYAIAANGDWTAAANEDWVRLDPSSGSGNSSVTVTIDPHTSTAQDRTASITFTCGTAEKTVKITQAKADSIAVDTENMTIAAAGDKFSCTVTANGDWEATTDADWIELKRPVFGANTTLTVTVKPNESTASDREGVITFACGTAYHTVTITQAKADSIAVSGESSSVASSGATRTYTIAANGAWTAVADEDWVRLDPSSGRGNGAVTVSVDPNTSTDKGRTATITFTCGTAHQSVTITQAKADSITVTTTTVGAFGAAGGKRAYTVKANGNWTVETDADWLMPDKTRGSGTSTVKVTVDENTSVTQDRTGTLIFTCGTAVETVTITQEKLPYSVTVTNSGDATPGALRESRILTVNANSSWKATTDASWLKLNKSSGSSGETKLTLTIETNTSITADRTGTITFTCGTAQETVTITQAMADSIKVTTSSTGNMPATNGERTYTVTANGAWTVKASQSWINLDKVRGNGNGAVKVTVDDNKGTSDRSGTITFTCGEATQTVTITQQKADSIKVTTGSGGQMPASKGERTYTVTANGSWTAKVSDSWLSLSRASGDSGDTRVTVTVAANTSTSDREGTVTFTCGTAATTVTITQARADSVKVTASSSKDLAGTGDTRGFSVVANGAWTAEASENWIRLDKVSGNGNGSVKATVEANPSTSQTRTGSITFTCGTATTTVTIRQEKGSPFNVVMSKPSKTRLGRQNSAYVYSGPGTSYYRAANGKAECTVYEDFYVWGYDEGWYMITYETNGGANRTGYIRQGSQKGDFTGTLNTSALDFAHKAAKTTGETKLTDDPDGLRTTIFTLKSGTSVTYLGSYSNNGRDWYYIECTVNGKKTRGFIPAGTLQVK